MQGSDHAIAPIDAPSTVGSEHHSSANHSRTAQEISTPAVHGMTLYRPSRRSHPREYNSWRCMKGRCRSRGLTLDPRFASFSDFMSHMGPMPGPGYTLDRLNTSLPEYSPQNCRWATKTEQTRNRVNTVWLTDQSGDRRSAAEWSRANGIPLPTIMSRLRRGASEHDAVTLKPGERRATNAVTERERAAPYIHAWRAGLEKHHNQKFFVATPKYARMLKEIAGSLAAGGIADVTDALTTLIANWEAFTAFAKRRYGAFSCPEVPTTEYALKNIQAAGNFLLYLKEMQQRDEQHAAQMAETAKKREEMRAAEEAREAAARAERLAIPGYRELEELEQRLAERRKNWDAVVTPELIRWYEDFARDRAFYPDLANVKPENRARIVVQRRLIELRAQVDEFTRAKRLVQEGAPKQVVATLLAESP